MRFQTGVAGLLVLVVLSNLHHRTELAEFGIHVLVGLGVLSQQTLAAGLLRVGEGLLDRFVEIVVEALQHILPLDITFGNVVKLLLHLGGETVVHDRLEVVLQIFVHHDADVGREEFVFLVAVFLFLGFLFDMIFFEDELAEVAFAALTGLPHHIFAFLDGGDGGGVGGRTADAKLFQLLHEAGFGVSRRRLGKFLHGLNLGVSQRVAHFYRRQPALYLLFLLIGRFSIDFQETLEQNHLAVGHKLLVAPWHRNGDGGLFGLGVAHLAGEGALPDQLVQTLGEGVAGNGMVGHRRGTDSLVGFLRADGFGLVFAGFGVFSAVQLHNLFFGGGQCEGGEVHGVGTHVGDVTGFVQLLGHYHGFAHRETEFAGGFLLQGGGGKRRCRRFLAGVFLHRFGHEMGAFAVLQELHGILFRLKAGVELRIELLFALLVGREATYHAVGRAGLELVDFAFALHNQLDGNRLHTSGRQLRFHLAPQYRRQLEAHKTVEDTAGLLGVHEVHIQLTGVGQRVVNGRLRDFVENNSLGLLRRNAGGLHQMPGNGLSLAVIISCEPDRVCLVHHLLDVGDQFFLF